MAYIDPYQGGWARTLTQAGANISGIIERSRVRRRARLDARMEAVATRAKRTGDINEWLTAMGGDDVSFKDQQYYSQLHGMGETISPGGTPIPAQKPGQIVPKMLEAPMPGGLQEPVAAIDLPGVEEKLEQQKQSEFQLKQPQSGNLIEPPTLEPTMAISQPQKPKPQFGMEQPGAYEVPLPTTAEGLGIRATHEKQRTGTAPDWATTKMKAPEVELIIQQAIDRTKGGSEAERAMAEGLVESFTPYTEGKINIENLISGPEKMGVVEATKMGIEALQDPDASPEDTQNLLDAIKEEAAPGYKTPTGVKKTTLNPVQGMAAMQNLIGSTEDFGQVQKIYNAAKADIEKLTGQELPPVDVFQNIKKGATFSETMSLLSVVKLSPTELTNFAKTGDLTPEMAERVRTEIEKSREPTTSFGQLTTIFANSPDWDAAREYWEKNEGRVPPKAIAEIGPANAAETSIAWFKYAEDIMKVFPPERLIALGITDAGSIIAAIQQNKFPTAEISQYKAKLVERNKRLDVLGKEGSDVKLGKLLKEFLAQDPYLTAAQKTKAKSIRNKEARARYLASLPRVGAALLTPAGMLNKYPPRK